MASIHRELGSKILALALAAILSAAASAVAGVNQWTALGPDGATVLDVLVDPDEPSRVLLGTPSGVYGSADGGRSWELLSDLPAEVLARSRQDRTLFAAVGEGVYKSDDGGATWTGPLNPIIAPPAFQRISDLVVDPLDGDTVMAFGIAGRLIGLGASLQVTHDGGVTWTRQSLPSPEAAEIVVDPRTPTTVLFAGLGIFRSRDGGATWEEVLEGFAGEFDVRSLSQLAIAPSDPRFLYASANVDDGFIPFRLWKSTDGGDTWEVPSADLDGVAVRDLAVAPDDPLTVYAATSDRVFAPATGAVYVSHDGAVTWELLGADLALPVQSLSVNPLFPRTLYAGTEDAGVYKLTRSVAGGCAPGEALCVGDGRFHVEAAWEDFQQRRGLGRPMPLTSDTGYLWFFDDDNVEVMVKVLDGRGDNGHFWVFFGALSNVGYTLQVTDTVEERVRTYRNPPRRFASFGDIMAFPAGEAGTSTAAPSKSLPSRSLPRPSAIFGCGDLTPNALCFDDRFELTVSWRDFAGRTGIGMPVTLTGDSGYFWFFDSDNVELIVKVLDGRGTNGHFWVFYGALSNVEFTLEVEDLVTGESRTYFNPLGTFASVGDVEALPDGL